MILGVYISWMLHNKRGFCVIILEKIALDNEAYFMFLCGNSREVNWIVHFSSKDLHYITLICVCACVDKSVKLFFFILLNDAMNSFKVLSSYNWTSLNLMADINTLPNTWTNNLEFWPLICFELINSSRVLNLICAKYLVIIWMPIYCIECYGSMNPLQVSLPVISIFKNILNY